MKIQTLFSELEKLTQKEEPIFTLAGMVNLSNKMQYGFFPVGVGILTKEVERGEINPIDFEINPGGVMVLGNDFGTLTYTKNCGEKGEVDGTTVNNLRNERVGLNLSKTFFTNFYLGVRDDIKYEGTTMRKRIIPLTEEYKTLCAEFFIIQLKLIEPSIIICLGHDVKNALIDSLKFSNWKPKSISLKKLYEEDRHIIQDELSKSTFVVIPHPCDSRNFNAYYIKELRKILVDL